MKRFLLPLALTAGLLVYCLLTAMTVSPREEAFIQNNFAHADTLLKNMLNEASGLAFPRTADESSQLKSTTMYDWTSGFFPGSLWYAYEAGGDESLKRAAIQWTEKLEPLKTFTEHHDLGFMMYCSYGNAYRLTNNPAYKDILVQSARSLSTRFSPKTGSIKSWNKFVSWHGQPTYTYPVIIDNMMNLELLFFASKVTGDSSFRQIAITHADNVIKHQLRPDYSCYHVVCYDPETGRVQGRETAQGYADNSTWSRGQAWGIYGFSAMYRETKDPKYLHTAQKMADYYLNHKNLPADKVPLWDFNVNQEGYTPGVNAHTREVTVPLRDASAAAITASALLELSGFLGKTGASYRTAAITMLHSLAGAAYRANPGENANFILKHSVGSIPHGVEKDVPLVYADYYFLEALLRYKKLTT
ncbi:glycoside hydrolase family 88 protein [Spirosoma endophyticum]|uniref:Glycosyl Hydrolase Family 88 n=1 Tax=Spirosoma endophyticum TaxID=662367 RepID=A0A1I2DRG9_9BACT|nr:glycoside hydrolase family 88 protein [Spirosoma endophyticum]SFE83125.1 Glycosyl Hydrolase Family 88 [Spirosoma endophyticum]